MQVQSGFQNNPLTNCVKTETSKEVSDREYISRYNTVKMGNGQLVSVDTEVSVPFELGNQSFNEKFHVLKYANSLFRGNLFFKKHNIQICIKNILLIFPDTTIQVFSIMEMGHKNKNTKSFTVLPNKKDILKQEKSTLIEYQRQ